MEIFSPPAIPDRAMLLARARTLVPLLAARAADTEHNRALLPEIHAALAQTGLFRILQPPYLGGFGLDIGSHLEVAAELARGCGSSAWIQCLVGYQNYLVGWYPREAQDRVRADGRPLFTGLVMGPPVTAERVAGGVRLSGRWPYVSGVDHATWLLLSARDPDQPARVLTCLVRQGDGRIEDDWHAMGMRGTGSKSFWLDRLFVRDPHVLVFREAERDGVPGAQVNDGPLYGGVPTSTLFGMVVAAPSLGLAAAAIEHYRARLRTRTNPRMPLAQSEWPTSQMRLGQAHTRLDWARRSFFAAAEAFSDGIRRGAALSAQERIGYRMTVVETVRVCTAIVYDLFTDAGTGVMLDGDPLQRCFRDIHVLRSHFMLTPDPTAENAGRIDLGLPPKPPFL